jgi:fumarylacetoacetate (FAA) hydrolase family protein
MDKWCSAVISGDNINVRRESEWYFSATENVLVIEETERERCVSFDNGFNVPASIEVEVVNIDT